MSLNRNFWKYIKEKKNVSIIAIALALGLLLIAIGSEKGISEPLDLGLEERLSVACSGVDGVGECVVLVYYSPDSSGKESRIESVIVICDGADSDDVRLRLTEMLSSFFGIGSNRIRIEKKS